MNLPSAIKNQIVEAIAMLNDRLAKDPQDQIAAAGLKYNALPLLADLGGTICLRPSGELIGLGWDDEGPVRQLDSVNDISALVAGAEKYPWLSSLLPARTESDPDCPTCGGLGKILVGAVGSGMFCADCQGLGWKQLTNRSMHDRV